MQEKRNIQRFGVPLLLGVGVFILLYLLLSIPRALVGQASARNICFDSDGNYNLNEQAYYPGKVQFSYYTLAQESSLFKDQCSLDPKGKKDYVVEYYCQDTQPLVKLQECTLGCKTDSNNLGYCLSTP